ncbi:hypothetical protein PC111_g20245 [Phytophthora cactorum]|nr:hypothetical protein PC111_g20245 [Phytophthora cactorum]
MRPNRPLVTNYRDRRAEEELDRWLEDPVDVERDGTGAAKENVLEFWRRLEHQGDYRIIPKAVRVLFAMPSSSCQIERDFGISGNMCEAIPKGEHHLHTPKSFVYAVDEDMDVGLEDMPSDLLTEFVSSTSLGDDWSGWGEEEEKSSFRCVRAATAAVSSMLSSPSSTRPHVKAGTDHHSDGNNHRVLSPRRSSSVRPCCDGCCEQHFFRHRPPPNHSGPALSTAAATQPVAVAVLLNNRGDANVLALLREVADLVEPTKIVEAVRKKKTSLEDDGVDDSSKEITTYYSKHHNGADHVQRSGGALAATHGQSVVLAQLEAQFQGEDADEGDQVGGGPPSGTSTAPALARLLVPRSGSTCSCSRWTQASSPLASGSTRLLLCRADTRGGRPGGAHEDRRGRPQSASLHGHARRRVVRGLREHAVPSQKKTSLEDDGVDDSSKEITTYYSKHHNGADHVQRSGGALAATHGQSVVLAQLEAQFQGEDADEGDQVGGGPPSGTSTAPALARLLW